MPTHEDMLEVVIAGAPSCQFGRRQTGVVSSVSCGQPAVVFLYDSCNANYVYACAKCADMPARSEFEAEQRAGLHPTIRLPHADALERLTSERAAFSRLRLTKSA